MQLNIIYFILFLYRKAHPDKVSDAKQYRTTPDWSDDAVNSDHLWAPAQMSGDLCYAGDMLECTVSGNNFYQLHLSNSITDIQIIHIP